MAAMALVACGKGIVTSNLAAKVAGIDCLDIGGDWSDVSGKRENVTITQNGCESVTGPFGSGTITVSTSETDFQSDKIDSGRIHAEFSKESITLVVVKTVPNGPENGELAGKSVTMRSVFTKLSADYLKLEASAEGDDALIAKMGLKSPEKILMTRTNSASAPASVSNPPTKLDAPAAQTEVALPPHTAPKPHPEDTGR